MADRETLGSFEDSKGASFIKSLALVFYIFNFILPLQFTASVLSIILLLAIDFWIVKNVSGRLLAGLRWWNKVEDDGSSNWLFESRSDSSKINSTESWIFWSSLLVYPIIWIFFIFVCLIKLSPQWLVVTVIGAVLTGANVVGYMKCRKDAGTKLTSMAGQLLGQQILKQALAQTETR